MTLSALCARNALAPSITCFRTGLPPMPENTACATPARPSTKRANSGSAASPRSVTTRGRVRPASTRWLATRRCAPSPNRIAVGKANLLINGRPPRLRLSPLRCPRRGRTHLGTARRCSYDLEIALAFPIGDRIEPLSPFPVTGGGEVVDEIVAEPVAGAVGRTEDARRLDQRARRTRNVLRADVRAFDRRRIERQVLLDAVE